MSPLIAELNSTALLQAHMDNLKRREKTKSAKGSKKARQLMRWQRFMGENFS